MITVPVPRIRRLGSSASRERQQSQYGPDHAIFRRNIIRLAHPTDRRLRRVPRRRWLDSLSRYTSGTWTLPGGGVDHGEHPEEAVIREVAEETGYAARVRNLIGIHSNTWTTLAGHRVHSVNVMYRVEIVDGELRYEVDGTSDMAAWVSPDQLTRYAHTKIVDVALKQTTDWH
ncbi:NUDIX domain-containing protein [Actinopolymorpha pittospori]|uniref:ADP-ribose pyrophosphatase YjhB (NUDIX family) n=1 Tax=Actinopolymorpha pittospori TaxID=648752 RepID=A0A927MRM8_9ACTN|nr:ADP-ribose pyrophosphatase YjhB (NUDIX family) [Actinopolymorpha pittospori]